MLFDKNSVVAIFESHERAEDAIRELQKDGFDMKKLSIVGKDYHTEENVVGYYTTGERMKVKASWEPSGVPSGTVLGSAFFWVCRALACWWRDCVVTAIVAFAEEAVVVGVCRPRCGLFSTVFRRTVSVSMQTRLRTANFERARNA